MVQMEIVKTGVACGEFYLRWKLSRSKSFECEFECGWSCLDGNFLGNFRNGSFQDGGSPDVSCLGGSCTGRRYLFALTH